jgi:hypothetical protein
VYIIVHPDGTKHKVAAESVIWELYHKLARVPHKKELPKGYKESYIKELKRRISLRTEYIPLFDIHTKNIYIIEPDNLYIRIAKHDYRLPDEATLELIKKQIDKYTTIVKSYKKEPVPVYYNYYLEQLHKHINFLNNYELPVLRNTFYKVFFNNNPSIRELTSCRRPSFFPSLRNKPYYTKTEMINLSLNLNLKINIDNLDQVCDQVSENDIQAKSLNEHMLYIEKNNASAFVQLYTFVGSYHMNRYLRYASERDMLLEKNIFLMWSLIKKSPHFHKDYYVFRFVNDVEYFGNIKVGDVYEEKSFMSTTRNPFYNPKDNIFGYNLIKIKLPKDKPGMALSVETQSFFPDEEEIILAPGRLQLVSIDDNFTYHHPNAVAESRINRKYEFIYLESFDTSPILVAKDYPAIDKKIPLIDFSTLTLDGSTIKEKINVFFDEVVVRVNEMRYFATNINNTKYLFQVYYREDVRAYDKYFFIQNSDHMFWVLQDEETKEIIMYVEIREKMSVNFIFRFIGGTSPFSNEDLLMFLSRVALVFNIQEVFIHDDYVSYEDIANTILQSKQFSKDNLENPDVQIQHLFTAKYKFYPRDVINYVISKGNYIPTNIDKTYIPRFLLDSTQPFFKKDEIDELAKTKAMDVLNTSENNLITKLYFKFSKEFGLTSALDFYLYLHYNYFYFIRIYNKYLKKYYERLLRPPNIWDATFYIFQPMKYLYSKGIIHTPPQDTSYEHIDDRKKSSIIKKIRQEVGPL